jgi:hypothetical protein
MTLYLGENFMKNIIVLLTAVTFSLFAKAKNADRGSLFMVSEIIKLCPAEFSKSMLNESSILNITHDSSKNSQGRSVTTLTMTTGYVATPMNPEDIVRNTVTLVKTAKAVQPLDGWLEDSVCTLIQL